MNEVKKGVQVVSKSFTVVRLFNKVLIAQGDHLTINFHFVGLVPHRVSHRATPSGQQTPWRLMDKLADSTAVFSSYTTRNQALLAWSDIPKTVSLRRERALKRTKP
ncbi:hypothetical protein DMENIID0001_080760 [Sergentomyia squamirostris]